MGIFASLLSAVFSAAKDLLSKRLAQQIDGMTSTFASFAFALPFYVVVLAVLYAAGVEVFLVTPAFLLLVLLRSLTDVLGEGMKMYAFSYADISVASCFFSLSPLLLLLVSPLITGDPLSASGIVATVLVVAGSLLLYRPGHRSWAQQKKGIVLALTASFFFALNSCFDRLAAQNGTPVFAGFAMTLLSCGFLVPAMLGRPDRIAALSRYRHGLWWRGFLEVVFMSAKLYALQFLQAPYVVSLQRVSLLLTILGGRVFFKEEDFLRRLIAGLLILAGVLVIVLCDAQK